MTNDIKYANSLAEVLYYLQGIQSKYVEKIPLTLMKYLTENATKHYNCNFDYNKPLNEIDISDDAKGIIALIAINYWCNDLKQKEDLTNRLKSNVEKHEYEDNVKKELKNKEIGVLYKNEILNEQTKSAEDVKKDYDQNKFLMKYKQSIFKRIFNKIKSFFTKIKVNE